jgi:hypothetical protein
MRRVRADRPVDELVRQGRQPDRCERMLLAGGSVLGGDLGLQGPQGAPDPTRGEDLWVQDSSGPVVLPDDASGIMAFRQECWMTPNVPPPGFPSRDKGSSRPPQAPTNSRQIQHFADDLPRRLDRQATGKGARLVAVALAAGCTFELVWVRLGSRDEERRLKNQKAAPRLLCPVCPGARPRRRPAGVQGRLVLGGGG